MDEEVFVLRFCDVCYAGNVISLVVSGSRVLFFFYLLGPS